MENKYKELLLEIIKNGNMPIKKMILDYTDCPEDIVELLSEDTSSTIQAKAIMHPNFKKAILLETLPTDVITRLLNSGYVFSEDELFNLSKHKSVPVRKALSKREDLNDKTFKKLAEDNEVLVRQQVAINNNLTDEAIDILLKDERNIVLKSLASNLFINEQAMLKLLSFNIEEICFAVAKNPVATNMILMNLLSHESERVAQSAKENLDRKYISFKKVGTGEI